MEKAKFNQKQMYSMIQDFIQGKDVEITVAEMVDFLDGRIAQVSKKSTSKPKGPSAENVQMCKDVAAWMAEFDGDVTISAVRKAFDVTSQKATAIMKMLETAGTVIVDTESDKKARHFVLA